MNELGQSWESAVFGGRIASFPPPAMDTLRQQWNQRLIMCAVEDFPNYKLLLANGHGVDEAAHRDDTWFHYLVPLSTSSSFFTINFWTVMFPKYSVRAFRIPQIARMKWSNKLRGKLVRCGLRFAQQETEEELKIFGDLVRNREALWTKLRPW